MTRSVSFVPQHRLASLLRRAGGVRVDVAVEEAEQRVQALKEDCVGVLDAKIDQLGCMVAEWASPTRLYAASSEIYSLAATFEVTELSQAASSLCDLLTWTQTRSEAELKRAVEVHLNALRTLRRPELSGDAAARISVVEGLRQIALKYKTE
jgi:hypothetical protein